MLDRGWWSWSAALVAAFCTLACARAALAYDVYNDGADGNCASCHGDFNASVNYVSKTDSVAWGTNLHDGHRDGMLSGECDTCHSSGGRSPVRLNSSRGGAGLDAISCMGCHGRAEDDTVSNPSFFSGYGAGLRQHHYDAGITACAGCHADADPTMYTPVGEEVLPPYYSASAASYPDMPRSSCNPSGTETFHGAYGLDNDGDGFYDDGDTDCSVSCTDLDGDTYAIEGAGCGPVDCNDGDAEVHPGATESCNGVDDDCDSSTDEDFTTLGDACTVGLGACESSGTYVCNSAGDDVECDATPGGATSELCNGIDDDCDGTADEDFTTLGDACTVGVGACEATGTIVCDGAGISTECSASPGTGTTETCNGIDDDCDGTADEDFTTLGDACTVGVGECERTGSLVCNSGGDAVECSASPGSGTTETCNGLDDDCDGSADEALTPPPCALQLGVCAGTVQTCGGTSGWLACDGSTYGADYEAVESSCDGLDNDCDGLADETHPSLGGSCTVGVGECASTGTVVCDGAGTGTECSATPGTGTTETCNGLDDDCDGTADEDYPAKGNACTVGVGACENSGTMVCTSAGDGLECSASPGTGTTETCNGVDDDCDGTADDGLTAPACSLQLGVCSGAVQTCGGGSGWLACGASEYGAGYESVETSCDGLDNDCDGTVDGLTRSCSTACGAGDETCTAGSWGGCTAPVPTTEICNGVDDDCDGDTDEGCSCTNGDTRPCGTDVGECVAGSQTCLGGTWRTCGGGVGPATETCNGLDDDCDGVADEDYPSKGAACSVGVGACESTGTVVCTSAGDGVECSATPGTAGTETCNGVDDDCDGSTDEDLTAPSCALTTGVCAGTVQTCGGTSGWIACDGSTYGAGYEATETRCDGLDNDCDGSTDETHPTLGNACTAGVGACEATGTLACNTAGDGVACTATPGAAGTETCNGVDDDCDGSTDEDLTAPSCSLTLGVCAGRTQTCGGTGGWLACDGSTYGSDYQATESRCDGLDNDCDGVTDETHSTLGNGCTVGTGACEATGTLVCNTAGDDVTCDATEGTAGTETCNGVDDDCDGSTDEDLSAPDCALTQGVCTGSAQTCGGSGGWQACDAGTYGSSYEATETSCDGLDNDCDGVVDGMTRGCSTACGSGTETCTAGAWGGCTATEPSTETCNGLDDDCDGTVPADEIDDDTDGTSECEGDCDDTDAARHPGATETCNGVDDDCDDSTDEDFTTLGDDCDVGVGSCTGSGNLVCTTDGTGVECDATAGTPGTEVCNGFDDDCDGETDEGCDADAGPPDAGPVDAGSDAGSDAGPPDDAGALPDASAPSDAGEEPDGAPLADGATADGPLADGDVGTPSDGGGCSCSASGADRATDALLGLAVLLLLLWRRRRRPAE